MSPVGKMSTVVAAIMLGSPTVANAGEGTFGWLSGDWYLTLGATGMVAPKFEGSNSLLLSATPIISLGKVGPSARFTSRNDNISLALVDDGGVRAGLTGKFLFSRSSKDELKGLDPVRWGGEVGGFFEFYPTDWLRARAELRHGIRAHDGFVADIAADAFYDMTPTVRISGGPRVSFASSGYFDSYYGVNAKEAAASGLSEYHPGGGLKSTGLGGAITWKVTEPMTASLFGEYARLMGPAADSSLVKQRGQRDQFTVGVSTTYRFNFSM